MIEKKHKGLKLKVEGTLLGKIGTFMDKKDTKTLFKEQNGGKAYNETKTQCRRTRKCIIHITF